MTTSYLMILFPFYLPIAFLDFLSFFNISYLETSYPIKLCAIKVSLVFVVKKRAFVWLLSERLNLGLVDY